MAQQGFFLPPAAGIRALVNGAAPIWDLSKYALLIKLLRRGLAPNVAELPILSYISPSVNQIVFANHKTLVGWLITS